MATSDDSETATLLIEDQEEEEETKAVSISTTNKNNDDKKDYNNNNNRVITKKRKQQAENKTNNFSSSASSSSFQNNDYNNNCSKRKKKKNDDDTSSVKRIIEKGRKNDSSNDDSEDPVSTTQEEIRNHHIIQLIYNVYHSPTNGDASSSSFSNGYKIARNVIRQMKDKKEYDKLEGLTYGEIDIFSFATLLQRIQNTYYHSSNSSEREEEGKNKGPTSFYDIGSGTGLSVLVAATIWKSSSSLRKSCGIEIIKELHEKAISIYNEVATSLKEEENNDDTDAKIINFIHGNTFDEKYSLFWNDADVVYAPITCWTDEMISKVYSTIVKKMKRNSIYISVTYPLPSTKQFHRPYRLLFQQRCKYGKGAPMFYVYQLL